MKIMVLDNYDSFTYNLVHMLKEISGCSVDVFRNNQVALDVIGKYDKIVISPGPGIPDQAGITKEMIEHYAPSKSILGVCLGCQAIAEVFGGSLNNLSDVFHGVATNITICERNENLFTGIPDSFTAGRYHSWVVNESDLPAVLKVTAKDDDGMVMALAHNRFDVKGVQFHPESVLTKYGKQMIGNWIKS